MRCRLFFGWLVVGFFLEFDADQTADAAFLHSDAVKNVGGADGSFVVGDDDELGVLEEAFKDVEEAVDVGFVQRGVQFVQQAKGAGLDLVNGEEQGDGGHGLFAAGEQADVLQAFAGRAGDDVDAAFEDVGLVGEVEVGVAAGKDFLEKQAEVVADALEGLEEHFAGLGVDAVEDFVELGFGLDEVVVLAGEELEALFGFSAFFDGDEVDGADAV